MNASRGKSTARDICLIGLMVAVIEACKMALASIPNVELTSFWIILFALCFGKRIFFVIPVFILLEGVIFGFGLWWLQYLYCWPLLAVVSLCLRKIDSAPLWALISGAFGLMFGLLCSFPYIFIGAADGDLMNGLRTAFAWWVAGIPWDLIHGGANFAIMLVLYYPVSRVMKKLTGRFFSQPSAN